MRLILLIQNDLLKVGPIAPKAPYQVWINPSKSADVENVSKTADPVILDHGKHLTAVRAVLWPADEEILPIFQRRAVLTSLTYCAKIRYSFIDAD